MFAFIRALLGLGTVGVAVASGQAPRVNVAHEDQVVSVAFSTDHVASATFMNRAIRLFDASTGELVRTLTDDSEVQAVAFSPDGRHLVSGGFGGATVWTVPDGQRVRRVDGVPEGYGVGALSFSADSARFALAHTSSGSVAVRLFEVATGLELAALPASEARREAAVALSPDGRRLASPEGTTVRLFDVATREEVQTLRCFGEGVVGFGSVSSVVFSPDGALLAGALRGGYSHEVVVWDVESGRVLARPKGHAELVWSLAFSPDGRTLATGSDDRAVRIFSVPDGRELLRLEQRGGVRSVAFSPDGRTLAVGDRTGALALYAIEPLPPR